MKKLKLLFHNQEFQELLTVTVMLAATFFLLAPLELYYSNISEFWFEIEDIIVYQVLLFGIAVLVLMTIGWNLHGRMRNIFICIIYGLGIAIYIQGNYLNGNMLELNGQPVDWLQNKGRLFLNILIWGCCFIIPVLCIRNLKKVFHTVIVVSSLMVIGMQTAGVISLAISSPHKSEDVSLTTEDMFSLSSNKNIIIFIVDTLDAQYYEEFMDTYHKYDSTLKDFQYFDNMVSGGGPTMYGVPMLLTGVYYDGSEYKSYLNNAYYSKEGFYKKLKKNEYDTRIFTSDEYISPAFYHEYVNNVLYGTSSVNSISGLLMKLYQLVGYKYGPVVLKNKLYLYSGEFAQFETVSYQDDADVSAFRVDDAEFIENYRNNGIKISEEMKNAFRVYHLYGCHPPYTLDENGTNTGEETTFEQQLTGVFNLIQDFIENMKNLGVYDSSTIIITGDHGAGRTLYQNPCFLIKTVDSTGEQKMVSHAPVSFVNVLPTLSEAINGINDEKEHTVFEIKEGDPVIRYQVVSTGLLKQYYGGGLWPYARKYTVGSIARDTSQMTFIEDLYKEERIGQYKIGDTISFTTDQEAKSFIVSGFGNAGENGSWSTSTEAVWKLRLKKNPKKNVKVNINLQAVFNAPQYVTIYFNDICVYSQYQNNNTISFIVPQEVISSEVQEIRWRLTTNVPADISGSEDTRDLCIRVLNMQMQETEETFVSVTPVENYKIGNEILFTEIDNGKRYFTKGLSHIETDAAWTVGKEPQIQLLIEDENTDMTGEIHLKSVYAPPQKVVIKSRSEILYEGDVTSAEDVIRFDIPKSCIMDGSLTLDFELPNAVSPAVRKESQDTRLLSLRIKSIALKIK